MLEVNRLFKRFKERTALSDVNLRVGEAEVFGCLGPNGAGKTTLMRVILGLLQPTSGEALLWGGKAGDDPGVRHRIGVLLESDGLYPRLTAYENLDYFARLYGVTIRGTRISQLIEFAGLSERAHDKVATFSRGMRRKLGLARALLHSPDLLMLDEPSAGLDPEAQKMVRDLIVRLSSQAQISVFLSSHDLDEVQRICGRVAILQNGRVRACDTLKALQSSTGAESVEITLADPSRLQEAMRLLGSQREVSNVVGTDASVSVGLRQGQRGISLAGVLEENDIKVEGARLARRSLEEVYLEIVRQERQDD